MKNSRMAMFMKVSIRTDCLLEKESIFGKHTSFMMESGCMVIARVMAPT
jgi:hypothetical protein